jgi:hypothetical protein
MVLAGVLVCGTCWLNAADDAPSAGLHGIIPEGMPVELTGAIAALPDNWKAWGDGMASELRTLYEAPEADAVAQRQAIAKLRQRMGTTRKHAADPQYRSILNVLVSISGGLKRRLDTAEAALDTLERGSELRADKVSSARKRVAREAQALDAYLGRVRNGSGWGKYLLVGEVQNAVVKSAGEGAAAPLSQAQSRLKDKNSLADAKARDFLSRPQFASYEQAVDGYLSALAAPSASANDPELRKGLKELLGALEDYEATHSGASATAVRKAFDAVRPHAPDAGEKLGVALRDNYFNYNMRVVASEAYLNKFVGQSRVESGPVRDFILGADVHGNQTTQTTIRLDLVPSSNTAQFDLTAQGQVASSTLGYTDQATVATEGNHSFTAQKRIIFNGESFSTAPARIGVSAHNTTTGAETNIGFPFRGIARGIAMNRAEGMRGESEAIAASRVQDRVLPPFNSEVDKEFRGFNPDIAQRLTALHELNLYPDAKTWSTTDSELKVATRLMAPGELGGSEPSAAMYLGRGMTILLHDSLMNNFADRLELAGKSMTDDEIKAKIEGQLTQLLGREVKFSDENKPADESSIKTIVFDKVDPLRMHADDGLLVLTIRAGFQQEGKEDIPTQIISVPLRFSVDMLHIIVETANISIEEAEKSGSPAQQLARAGVIRKKLDSAFPRREIDRVHHIKQKKVNVMTAVTRIRALDSWLGITYE